MTILLVFANFTLENNNNQGNYIFKILILISIFSLIIINFNYYYKLYMLYIKYTYFIFYKKNKLKFNCYYIIKLLVLQFYKLSNLTKTQI